MTPLAGGATKFGPVVARAPVVGTTTPVAAVPPVREVVDAGEGVKPMVTAWAVPGAGVPAMPLTVPLPVVTWAMATELPKDKTIAARLAFSLNLFDVFMGKHFRNRLKQ